MNLNHHGDHKKTVPMEKEVLIEVSNLSRYYADYCAVNDISFSVHRGEVIGFLGPNGAGKTTTMQIITGVLAASEGQVSIAGLDILENAKAAKMHIGFLPESPPLYFDLTVDEYLNYAACLRGVSGSDIKSAIDHCKQRCGLTEVGHRLIQNLSKGYQQRVGIAQAIIHSPSVVILDEPTSGLDPNNIIEIRDLIRELGNDHSVILSTHILPEVQTICDRVIIINRGALVLDETLSELNNQTVTRFKLGFKQTPSLDELSSVIQTKSIEQIDANRFHIIIGEDEEVLDVLIKHSLENHWGLFELTPDSNSLEQTFVQLTQ